VVAFNKITGEALITLNNYLDDQAEYIELIEAANVGTLDQDQPITVHVDLDIDIVLID
jgi:hypothetical protein